MNVSPLTVRELHEAGWDIVRVSEFLDPRTKDPVILAFARDQDRTIITNDLEFSALLALGRFAKPSVITLRLENPHPASVTRRLLDVAPLMAAELMAGAVLSVDEQTVRYRMLPIVRGFE